MIVSALISQITGSLPAQPKPVLRALGFHFCTATFSLLASGVAYQRFQEQGLVDLATSLNHAAILFILASLSLETGMVRRLMTTGNTARRDIAAEMMLLYFLGLACGTGYLTFFLPELSSLEIMLAAVFVMVSFPYSALRAQLIASDRADWAAAGPTITATSALFSALVSEAPSAIFLIMVLTQLGLMFLWMICVYLRSNWTNLDLTAFASTFCYLAYIRNLRSAIKQLRFAVHSMASGLQANEFLIVSRLFLVSYVGVDSAGHMEMYQRPLASLFGMASLWVSLFFYPAAVAREKALADGLADQRAVRRLWADILVFVCFFSVASGVIFPLLFWILFGFDAMLELSMAFFWISMFGLRLIGAFFSSWILALNRVSYAIVAELILYIPAILVMSLPEAFISKMDVQPLHLYVGVIGLSSTFYVAFFLIIMMKARNPFKKI